MDFSASYLTEQIIAYIGNKRKLIPLIYKAIQSTGMEIKPGLKFFDVFAGSGVVSRFAKTLDFEVFSNDWECYSYVLNSCYLETDKSELADLFGSEEALQNLLDEINSLPSPGEDLQYMAKYYAPKSFDIDNVDYKTERLFYTRDNALAIDKIRNYIEDAFPAEKIDETQLKKKNVLLAELIYEVATHNNTSGVFKACHKGFGGHNKDALKRILTPIRLRMPVLIDSLHKCHVFQENANEIVKKIKDIDIAYLDPPYNQHQYGSNYHILNTVAKWDHIPAELELNTKGELKEKAAIRHDWVNTRSLYCYKEKATKSFEELIANLDAKHILISYSTDGIIPFEDMQRICIQKGSVSIVTNEYTTYRGGKQSNNRKNTNIEFILCIDTSGTSSAEQIEMLNSILFQKKCMLLFKQKFCEKKLREVCSEIIDSDLCISLNDKKLVLHSDDFFEIEPPDDIASMSIEDLRVLYNLLLPCACNTKEEELEEIISKINGNAQKNVKFIKLIPATLKKLAHKKNKESFYKWADEIKKIAIKHEDLYELIRPKIDAVIDLAEVRFNS